MQSEIPAVVSTMPANAPRIMGENRGALSPAMPLVAVAGLRERLRWGLFPDCPGEENSDCYKEARELQRKGAGWEKVPSSPTHGDGSGKN